MSDELTFSPQQMRAAATRLQDLQRTLSDAARTVDSAHTDLHTTWTGSAASSMMTLWQREFTTVSPFLDRLTELATSLAAAADSMESQEAANTASIEGSTPPPSH
ncbi:WXG100 family type VII secretion target [Nocardia sp. NPDC057227]|uniref:WXG100 family type VII secretion target n=1 Tax=Nocardia sp. NPDC057227 TaxID=3346056 RepID=UPI0036354F8F